jgi:C_GCAxxG_C_C family probable redox protein
MKTKEEIALAKFNEGYNCAQSVLYAYADELNIDKDFALRLTTGFGAGMARHQEVCGAVSGGVIVLSLKNGRGENQGKEATEATYAKIRNLTSEIQAKRGSYLCRELLHNCDLTTAEGQALYKKNDYFNEICKPCISCVINAIEESGALK